MGKAEIGLSAKLGGKFLVGVPKNDRGLYHMSEVELNSAADVAAIHKQSDAFDRLVTGL